MLDKKIRELASELFSEIVAIRRHLHANPELSFEEYKTSQYVQQVLDKIGIKYTNGWVKTGVIGHIEGKNPLSRIIALRADLDALPIEETNQVEYRSINAGVMHACGHDVHTSSLLGAAMILNKLRTEFEGTIKIIFQPGEEKLPGGAKLLIEEGGLKNPDAELIIGQHVFPEMETGMVGFRKGMYMASTDEIHLTISGKGGHAALPHQYNYTTMAAAEFMVATHQLYQSMLTENEHAVLAFGKMIANGATNVIPAEVKLEGTLRTLDENLRMKMHELIREKANEIGARYTCRFDLEIKKGYPVLYNHELVTQTCIETAQHYLGKEQVTELDIRMTAEDFAYYSQQVPACFYRLGTGNKSKGLNSPVHTSGFNIDEDALKIGSGLMAFIAIELLRQFPLPAK
jgi:amidohydrolase